VPHFRLDPGRTHDLADDLLDVLALLAAGAEDLDDVHGDLLQAMRALKP
jgi:hypothetical protein